MTQTQGQKPLGANCLSTAHPDLWALGTQARGCQLRGELWAMSWLRQAPHQSLWSAGGFVLGSGLCWVSVPAGLRALGTGTRLALTPQ